MRELFLIILSVNDDGDKAGVRIVSLRNVYMCYASISEKCHVQQILLSSDTTFK